MKYKNHKVSLATWKLIKEFQKENEICSIVAECGIQEPNLITKVWERVTCKNCLKQCLLQAYRGRP